MHEETNATSAPKQARWRVTTSAHSFDLERLSHIDKHGAEVWHKEAYCRSRAALLASLASRRLSASLADGVSPYHPDAYRALSHVGRSPGDLSEAQRAALKKAQAAKRAKAARDE